MSILEDEHGSIRARQDSLRHHLDQPAAAAIDADLQWISIGVVDAHGLEQDSRVGGVRCEEPSALGCRLLTGRGVVQARPP